MANWKKFAMAAAGAAGEEDVYWINLLYGSGITRAANVAADSSKNVIMAGRTNADGAGTEDILIAKYDASGVLQWDRTLGGSGSDQAFDVAIDSSDNIIISGMTNSDGAGSNDAIIAKYNSSGTLQWDKTLGTSENNYGLGVTVDSSDNVIVCGYRVNGADQEAVIAKLPPDGSGNGTYGGLTYQDAVLTDAAAVLTDAAAVLSVANAGLTSADAILTDAAAVLTDLSYEVTP